MPAKCLNGTQLSQNLCATLKKRLTHLRQSLPGPGPGLAVILVGEEPASRIYVQKKRDLCQSMGVRSFLHHFPRSVSEKKILACITDCNQDPAVSGILVQLPLPPHIHAAAVIEAMSPHKDVDGFHPYNLGRLAQQSPTFRPCTPYGIVRLLQSASIPLKGQHAVVVGASNIVGRPMALELLLEEATVTVCHEATRQLDRHVASADILIVAVGKRHIIAHDWVKPGAVVVDVGIHRLPEGKIVGDIDSQRVSQKASWITPVPGGVGPMTVAMLLHNTVQAYTNRHTQSE